MNQEKNLRDPLAIANFYILKKEEIQIPKLTHMKLQKLLYFAYGWHLAIFEEKLFNSVIEAWPFGPVIPKVYRAFKQYGPNEISTPYPTLGSSVRNAANVEKDPILVAFLEKIAETYGHIDAFQLSKMTHEKDTPWWKIASKYSGNIPDGTDIPDDLISDYFNTLYSKLSQNE